MRPVFTSQVAIPRTDPHFICRQLVPAAPGNGAISRRVFLRRLNTCAALSGCEPFRPACGFLVNVRSWRRCWACRLLCWLSGRPILKSPLRQRRRASVWRLGLECPVPGPFLCCHVVIHYLNNRISYGG